MGFDFGSFLGGFAERSREIADQREEKATRMAEATAKYRLESAVSRKREMDSELKGHLRTANKLRNYGYNDAQLLELAKNGRLDDVLSYNDKAAEKGLKVDASTVVTQAAMLPDGANFDSLFKDAIFGVPTKFEEKDIYGTKPAGKSGTFDFLFGGNTDKIARQTEEQYYKSAGMSAEDVARYSADAFTPQQAEGKIDLTPFGSLTEDKDLSTQIQRFTNKLGSQYIATTLDLGSETDSYGNVILKSTGDSRDIGALEIRAAMDTRMGQLLRGDGKTKGMSFEAAQSQVIREYQDATGGKRGMDALPAAMAWANGIRGIEGGTPISTDTTPPTPDKTTANTFTDVASQLLDIPDATSELNTILSRNKKATTQEEKDAALADLLVLAKKHNITVDVATDEPELDQTMIEGVIKAAVSMGADETEIRKRLEGVTTEAEVKAITTAILREYSQKKQGN